LDVVGRMVEDFWGPVVRAVWIWAQSRRER
jgi:hypothetical protein